jgi:hypothetical protein
MATDENADTTFQFFKAVIANKRSYLCDFHKINYRPGKEAYRIVLQTRGSKDITIDMECAKNSAWHIYDSTEEVTPDLEWALITAVVEYMNGKK